MQLVICLLRRGGSENVLVPVHVCMYDENFSRCVVRFAVVELRHMLMPEHLDEIESAREYAGDEAQQQLRDDLRDYDGWAVAAATDEAELWDGPGLRIHRWDRRVARRRSRPKRGSEALIVSSPLTPLYGPPDRLVTTDVMRFHTPRPLSWRSWMLAHLGARPGADVVVDFYTHERVEILDNMLSLEVA